MGSWDRWDDSKTLQECVDIPEHGMDPEGHF